MAAGLVLGISLGGGGAGCTSAPGPIGIWPVGYLPSRGAPSDGTTGRVDADWDDVDAAVDIAVSQAECGFEEWHDDRASGDRRRWYVLQTIREERATLEIRRERAGAPAAAGPTAEGPEPLVIFCKVGDSGDAKYEALIISLIADRLTALKGDRTAPIPSPWGINY